MKQTLCLLFAIVFANVVNAQLNENDTLRLKHISKNVTNTDRPPQAVFVELFGRGIFFSANYDRRFNKTTNGLGFSVGMGYVNIESDKLFTLPVGLNYLMGQNGKFFELGLGGSYFSGTVVDFGSATSSGSSFVGNLTIGYRSQPEKGGFMFRAGLNPFFFKNNFIPYYPYLSFGYNF